MIKCRDAIASKNHNFISNFVLYPLYLAFAFVRKLIFQYISYHNSQSITKRYAECALRVRVVFVEVKAGAALEGSGIKISLFVILVSIIVY